MIRKTVEELFDTEDKVIKTIQATRKGLQREQKKKEKEKKKYYKIVQYIVIYWVNQLRTKEEFAALI